MAPVIEPKRRVKSIKKPSENKIAKTKKPKKGDKYFSRAYNIKLVMKVLKRRANSNDSVHVIYKTYRMMVKIACAMVAHRYRRISMRDAQLAMAKQIPREVVMNVIREFRQQPAEEAPTETAATPGA